MLKYEDLIEEIKHRPLNERLSILEAVAQSIRQDVSVDAVSKIKPGAKIIKITDFDPDWQPSQEEIIQNKKWLLDSQKIAEEVSALWPENVSAVEAIREDRREL